MYPNNLYIDSNLRRVYTRRGFNVASAFKSPPERKEVYRHIIKDLEPHIYRNVNFIISLIESNPKFFVPKDELTKKRVEKYIEALVILISGGAVTGQVKNNLGEFFGVKEDEQI